MVRIAVCDDDTRFDANVFLSAELPFRGGTACLRYRL